MIDTFRPYLDTISNPEHQARMTELLTWVAETFPNLGQRIAWNHPMFTDHDTFIIGFSHAKQHLAVSPEYVTMQKFTEELEASGYAHTAMIFRIPWTGEINYPLLQKMIEFNIEDKKDSPTFWRK